MAQFVPPGGVPLNTPVGTDGLTLETLANNTSSAKTITDYFYINTQGQLAIYTDKLPTSQPVVSGTLWCNGGIIMVYYTDDAS